MREQLPGKCQIDRLPAGHDNASTRGRSGSRMTVLDASAWVLEGSMLCACTLDRRGHRGSAASRKTSRSSPVVLALRARTSHRLQAAELRESLGRRVSRRRCGSSSRRRDCSGPACPPRPWPTRRGCPSRWPSTSRRRLVFNERIVRPAPAGRRQRASAGDAGRRSVGHTGGLRDQWRGPADVERVTPRAVAARGRARGRPRGPWSWSARRAH